MIWFKKKCPMCNMKEEENKGVKDNGNWFCSQEHLKQYKSKDKNKSKKHSCC